ncbi:hypothetical protein FHG87_023739 [Trinorchestia longiramus]|nr:hypothetical protein FHG87_023739 [Trinorchestia longiramus]
MLPCFVCFFEGIKSRDTGRIYNEPKIKYLPALPPAIAPALTLAPPPPLALTLIPALALLPAVPPASALALAPEKAQALIPAFAVLAALLPALAALLTALSALCGGSSDNE